MKGWLKIALLVLIIFIAVGTFYFLFFASFFETTPSISRNSYLLLDIYGEIPERSPEDPITKIFTGEFPTMEGLLHCIRKAKIDPKIIGLVIRPLGSNMGWAKTEEIKQVIKDFKTTGKPIYFYFEMGGNRDYYLASEGNLIFGAPMGALIINGLLGRGYYLKGALDKLGIEADFVTHGKYKDAPEIFTREHMSLATQEVVNAILDDFYQRYVKDISQNRGIPQDKVKELLDVGLFTLEEAFEAGLIDTMMYFNEFKDFLKQQNNHKTRFVSYSRYKKVPFEKLGVKAKETFALIYCIGDIVSGVGDNLPEDGLIISQGMANTIHSAASNKNISAIILRIDSPGGSGIASDIVWREVVEARKEKPIIASFSDVAASGGYYIAMAADTIIAQPSSIVGSIGVYAGKFSFSKLYQKLGISKDEIPRGKNADLFSENSRFNSNQRKMMEDRIGRFYKEFVMKAAEGRGLTYNDIDRVAQGRVWTGLQSLQNGLIDSLGGLQEAIQIAKEMVGIAADDYVNIITYPRHRSFLGKILSGELDTNLNHLMKYIDINTKYFIRGIFYYRDYEPLFLMPYYFEIK